ncbi:MAG TPA: HNH endonuclease signature motif containing protein [Chlamydiales bacterium]|nr:HNH endonuclease signature motif containing protein [Chlamydiales bacterium]
MSHRAAEPLCRKCKERGVITAGTLVDHIVAIRDGGAEWDEDNLQTLCDRCHQVKRQVEKNGRAR